MLRQLQEGVSSYLLVLNYQLVKFKTCVLEFWVILLFPLPFLAPRVLRCSFFTKHLTFSIFQGAEFRGEATGDIR